MTDYLYHLTRPKDLLFGSIQVEVDDTLLKIKRDEKGRRVEFLSEGYALRPQARLTYDLLNTTKNSQLNQLGRLCVVGYTDLALFTNASPKEVESLVATFVQSGGVGVDLSLVSEEFRRLADEIYRPRADCRMKLLIQRYENLQEQKKAIEEGFVHSFELQKASHLGQATLRWVDDCLLYLRQAERLLGAVGTSYQGVVAFWRSSSKLSQLPRLDPGQIDELRSSASDLLLLSREIEAKKLARFRLAEEVKSSSFTNVHRLALSETYKALEIDLAGVDLSLETASRDLKEVEQSIDRQLLIGRGEIPDVTISPVSFEKKLSAIIELGERLSEVETELSKIHTIAESLPNEDLFLERDQDELSFKQSLKAAMEEFADSKRRLREIEDRISRVKRRRVSPVVLATYSVVMLIVIALAVISFSQASPFLNYAKIVGIIAGLLLLLLGFFLHKGSLDEVDKELLGSLRSTLAEQREMGHRLSEQLGQQILVDEPLRLELSKLTDEISTLSGKVAEKVRFMELRKSLHDKRVKAETERDILLNRIEREYEYTFNVCYRHGPVAQQALEDRELWRLTQVRDHCAAQRDILLAKRDELRATFDRHAELAFEYLSRMARGFGQRGELEELRRELCDLERTTRDRHQQLDRLEEEIDLLEKEFESHKAETNLLFESFGLLFSPSTVDELLRNLSSRREEALAYEIQRKSLTDGILAMGDLSAKMGDFFDQRNTIPNLVESEVVSYNKVAEVLEFMRSEGLSGFEDDMVKPDELERKVTYFQSFGEAVRDICTELDQFRDRLLMDSSSSARKSVELQEISVSDLAIEIGIVGEEIKTSLAEFAKLSIGRELVDGSRLAFAKAGQPMVLSHASQIFSLATAGRYREIVAHRGGAVYVIDENNRELQTAELSSGTLDLLLLSLRVAFLDIDGSIQQGWPVIFDDVMVNIDSERRQHGYQAVLAASASRQVFYLTCHEDHAEGLAQAANEFRNSSRDPGSGWEFELIELDRISPLRGASPLGGLSKR